MAEMNIPVTITLSNPTDRPLPVFIPSGTVLEVDLAEAPRPMQNVVITDDYSFTINPREVRTVALTGNCLNQGRAVPANVAGRVTVFRYGGSLQQDAIWGNLAAVRLA